LCFSFEKCDDFVLRKGLYLLQTLIAGEKGEKKFLSQNLEYLTNLPFFLPSLLGPRNIEIAKSIMGQGVDHHLEITRKFLECFFPRNNIFKHKETFLNIVNSPENKGKMICIIFWIQN
jgi:hypothetical protein